MPNAKHKEKVKEMSDVLKGCREVLYDGSNEIVAQMLAFMNRVDGRLKQIETQVNKIDEVKSSLVNITRHVSLLEITVKELKEKNIDIENSTQVMSDLFEDVKHNCIFILVLLLCCVSRSSLYCNIPSDLCSLCLSCYYFYIVLSLHLYCCYVVYLDHHFTVIYLQICVLCVCLLLLLYCFIFILVLLLCYVSRSSLYCNIRSDLCSQCFSYYYFYIVLSLHLYCCYVVYTGHHFTVITVQTRV